MEQVALYVPADQLKFTLSDETIKPSQTALQFVGQPNTKYPVQISNVILNPNQRLKVHGKAPVRTLVPNTLYEVVLGMMFEEKTTSWDDVTMRLKLQVPGGPNAPELIRKQSLIANPIPGKELYWRDMLVGDFFRSADMDESANLIFELTIDATNAKTAHHGLVIMGLSVRRVPNYPLMPPLAAGHLERRNNFHLDVTKLLIHRGREQNCWKLNLVFDKRDNAYVPELQLIDILWLDVSGRFDAKNLNQGSTYEVVLLISLDRTVDWYDRTTVTLKLNDQEPESKTLTLSDYANYNELLVGEITASDDTRTNGIRFSLSETTSGISKSGLYIKAAKLRKI